MNWLSIIEGIFRGGHPIHHWTGSHGSAELLVQHGAIAEAGSDLTFDLEFTESGATHFLTGVRPAHDATATLHLDGKEEPGHAAVSLHFSFPLHVAVEIACTLTGADGRPTTYRFDGRVF